MPPKNNIDTKECYVYRHTKLGTSDVFYIGIGNTPEFQRAKTIHGRNRWWEYTVEKYNFDYEILATNLSWEEACELEIILIAYYGRKDCCGGCLVNLTDGGDGTLGVLKTPEQIAKWKESNIGKQDGELNVMFGRTRGKHHLAKEVLHLETGVFFDCALDAAETVKIPYSTFKSKLNGKIFNDTGFVYAEVYEREGVPQKESKNYKKVIHVITGIIYNSIKEAALDYNMHPQNLSYKLNKSNTTDFMYLEDYKKGIIRAESKRGWKKYVLDTATGIYYESLKEASVLLKINYQGLKRYLGKHTKTNPTTLTYC